MSYTSHPIIEQIAKLNSFDSIRMLLSQQCTELGSGAFGVVFTHPDEDKVIKMCTNRDAYYQFARWCMLPQNCDNPHLPNIYEERVISPSRADSNMIFVYVIERLAVPQRDVSGSSHSVNYANDVPNILCGQYWKATCDIISSFKWKYNGFNKNIPSKVHFMMRLNKHINEKHIENPSIWPYRTSIKTLADNKKFIDTTYEIMSMFSAIANLDYHGGNIMWKPTSKNTKRHRNQGVLVITDPVASYYDEYETLMKDGKLASYDKIQHTTTTGDAAFGFIAPVVYEHYVSSSYSVSHVDLAINPSITINSLYTI